MMLGLDSTPQVEREEFSQPLVAHRPAADPLEHVKIRCFVNCDHAWSVVKQGDIPADHHLVRERGAMGISDQIDQLRPAWKLAMQNLRAIFVILLIPSIHGRPPGSAGGPPQLAGMNIHIGRDSPFVKIVDNGGAILRHAKNRIGNFEFASLITAAHYPDRCKGAIAEVGDLPVIHEPWLHQESSSL